MRRGDIHYYGQPGAALTKIVLLASNQAVLDSERPWLMGLDLLEEGDGDLLTVPIPEHGWVNTAATHRLYRQWVGERIASTEPETMERVEEALRASLDL
ncbi:hypothetical protein ACFXG4_50025 [Nocardia sp. NPDC059246]|uniref:hypothetical protein n=1 Tax=unclassified Nocardia TaxID=2637762 RepID=UPI0036B75AB4